MPAKVKVLHVITGLQVGGAEIMLCRLLENADHERFEHTVLCLAARGALSDRVEAAGPVKLYHLGMKPALKVPGACLELYRYFKHLQPDVVHTWLAHATLLGSLAARWTGNPPVIWGIHTGHQNEQAIKKSVRVMNGWLAKMSHEWPDTIVSCSQAAMERHTEIGFSRHRMELISNGTDTTIFRPDADGGARIRKELGIPLRAPVIGIAGRWTPEKDYPTFFKAALQLQEHCPDAHLIACGGGVDAKNEEIARYVGRSAKPEHFHLLGVRQDMPQVYAAMTYLALTSVSEAFPLTLGEGMACGVPCLSTDVGDCRLIVGDTGRIVTLGDLTGMVRTWQEMLALREEAYHDLCVRARARVQQLFSMERCARRYETLYADLGNRAANPRPANLPSSPASTHGFSPSSN